jgi:toxin ParE1/3/4
MRSFALTGKAKADLKDIASYTEQRWGKAQRNLYVKQMDEAFRQLAKVPLTGKACEYIKEDYRKFPQGSHVIFYRRINGGKIEIVRILHKSMDVDSNFINP